MSCSTLDIMKSDLHLTDQLRLVVPGSDLREGLNRVLKAHMGALLVLGDSQEVLTMASGGFHIDAAMTPQRLSELAKMDGAIILDKAAKRISWANVHLVPDASAPTTETGTRHRTAERVAKSSDVLVVAVSEEMGSITLYYGDEKRMLQPTEDIGTRSNRLVQALERQFSRIRTSENDILTETNQSVLKEKLLALVQQIQVSYRVSMEVEDLLTELGSSGRLLRLELHDLTKSLLFVKGEVTKRYYSLTKATSEAEFLEILENLDAQTLLDLSNLRSALGI